MTDSFLIETSKGWLGGWLGDATLSLPGTVAAWNRSEVHVETYHFTKFLQCLVCIILSKGNILLPDKLG